MEDSKWQTSAEQWESAYRKLKIERDQLTVKLAEVKAVALRVNRGCDCEYDHRCSNCQAVVDLHKILE